MPAPMVAGRTFRRHFVPTALCCPHEPQLWILQNLDEDLSIPALAARANMSARHFARRFAQRFGATPAAYILRARVEAARRRIEAGPTRMKAIARQCGFADEQGMRRAFQRTLGVAPLEYRARFGR
ncbi:MAG: helix-turn-helix domain-containing protein [Steroidobacteraceae bacterium]